MSNSPSTPLSPLYMWAGGKTKLLKFYNTIFPDLSQYENYVEPFFGGGAVYCDISNRFPHLDNFINDINPELVGLILAIRDDEHFLAEVNALISTYFSLSPDKTTRKAWYYKQRAAYWENASPALLYMLMRLGFNGIWQTCQDSHGLFGTPAGLLNQTRPEQLIKPELIETWHQHLQHTTITSGDYSVMTFPHTDSTFVYCDPPYRDSFTTYGVPFDDTEQKRLVTWINKLVNEDITVALSNRTIEGDNFFEDLMNDNFDFHYIPITYTAGRRKKTATGFEAKPAIEFLALSKNAKTSAKKNSTQATLFDANE